MNSEGPRDIHGRDIYMGAALSRLGSPLGYRQPQATFCAVRRIRSPKMIRWGLPGILSITPFLRCEVGSELQIVG